MDHAEPCRIIPFPQRAVAAEPEPDPGAARLQRSLELLQQALVEQGAAVAAWRQSLAELQAGMGDLRGSVLGYRRALDQLAAACAPVSR